MGTCSTCKYWKPPFVPATSPFPFGECTKIETSESFDPEQLAYSSVPEDSSIFWPLSTKADFGCILHKEKENA